MVSVTPDGVRERILVSAGDCPDDVVNRFIARAVATINGITGGNINSLSCTQEEETAVGNLAAIYCACRITGGSSSGLSFRVGDLQVSESQNSSALETGNLTFLLNEAKAIVERLSGAGFRVVQD